MIYLMIFYVIQIFTVFYLREEDIKKNARFLESEKAKMFSYFQNELFILIILAVFVLTPYMYLSKFNENYYIGAYVAITVIFFILSIIFNKKYLKIAKADPAIIAKQESNFGLKIKEKYQNKRYLSAIDKEMIKANNHFNFSIRRNDLTIQNIRLNSDFVNFEFEEFYKILQRKKTKIENNVLYSKLIKYLNSKAKYHKINIIKLENRNFFLLEIQNEIFKKVKELNSINVTLKLGQLYSIADDTFDFQFLNFIDSLKVKKYNNDSLMYAILFLKAKKL